ncbi:hypothetical protein K502DRAFT_353922 [Neoconidiobolus thromboides FSU 785]|nr:hypothetical protein K502DRAFT_353922 [Neoconidiobolus thromboides FSU 785]
MAHRTLIIEIVGDTLGVIALSINLLVGVLVILVRKDKSLLLGLNFMILTILCDIITPIVGIVQETISVSNNRNIMLDTHPCQILGIFHTLVPICSSCGIALLALERYFTIKRYDIHKWILWSTGMTIMVISVIFAVLTACYNEFAFTESRMMCMPLPNSGSISKSYYYIMMFSLILNTIVISFGYSGIILVLRDRKVLKSNPIISLKDMPDKDSDSNSSNSLTHINCFKNRIEHEKIKTPTRVIAKGIAFVACYIICICPAIFIMIYHAVMVHINKIFILSHYYSVAVFASLCSFSLANPIFLLLLHNKVYARLVNLLLSLRSIIIKK